MPAIYRLPEFNLTINVWRFGNPTSDPPDLTPTVNFAWDRRSHSDGVDPAQPEAYFPLMTVLAPTGTDIRGFVDNDSMPDTCEIPAASGRYYLVQFVDYIGCGFPNEHIGADVYRMPGSTPPPGDGFILLEDGIMIRLDADTGEILLE